MEIQKQVPLSEWTWWRIGGPAEYFCLPESLEDVREGLELARRQQLNLTFLGGGTNVLVSDRGVSGLVMVMRKFRGVELRETSERLHIEAWAGTPKSELTKIFLKLQLPPALFLCGLPGDVGGGVVMNAGVGEAMIPREFVDLTDWVEVLDPAQPQAPVRRIEAKNLRWSYRHSQGWQPGVIVRVGLSWPMMIDDDISRKVKDATKNRVLRQPLEWPSCGSTFKNPQGQKAGALIDQAGLKGFRIGAAQVSEKHANFIINTGGAKASDVKAVMDHVVHEVKQRFNVDLETEVKMIGNW